MNQTLSINRLGRLLNLHFSEHLRTYLMGLGVLAGVMTLLLSNTLQMKGYHPVIYRTHGLVFIGLFMASSCWFASEAFKVVHTPTRSISYLTLPASTLEKYLVALLLVLLYLPVFTAIFYAIEGSFFAIVNGKLPAGSERFGLMSPFQPEARELYKGFLLGLLAQNLFLLGSIYFPKASFVRTGIFAFAIFFGGIYLNNQFLHWMLPDIDPIMGAFPFSGFALNLAQGQFHRFEPTEAMQQAALVLWLLVIPALWFITYVRFKEKEV